MLLMTIVNSVVMAGAMATVGWGQRRDGIAWWAVGLLLYALAYGLFVALGAVARELAIVLGNVLLACAFAALLLALHRFLQQPVAPWLLALPPTGMALLSTLLLAHDGLRAAAVSLCLCLQMGLMLWALRRSVPRLKGRGLRLLRWALRAMIAVLLLRALLGVLPAAQGLSGATLLSLTFVASFAAMLMASLGFVFMSRDKLDASNRRLATTDALTGVANRRFIIFALDRDVARAKRTRQPIALMVLDIDHFKRVNDAYGHLGGDQVLRHVVNVLCDRVRTQDMVGRYGGEEFLVLLPDTDLAGALVLAEQLRQSVQDSVCHWQGQAIAVTISIGVYGGYPADTDSWDMLIDAADRAMYQAKQNGRNRVEVVTQTRAYSSPATTLDDPGTFPMSLQ
jgi:diguanylate cyclase (GGDEF)-like protein